MFNTLLCTLQFISIEMVTASAARAIKGDIEKDLPSNCSYKDLNQTPAEIASNILHKRERDNAESLLMLNLNEEKNRIKTSCLSESDETEERDDCNKSPSKILHPDDYRRRLIPFANIFNKQLPVFLPPPSHDEIEIINNENAANVGVEVTNNGYHNNCKNNGNNVNNGTGNGTGSIHGGDSSINTSHDSADSSAMLSETVNEDPDRRLNEIISQASVDKKSKTTMPVTRYYPALKWVMKAGVIHVFEVSPIHTNRVNQNTVIESKEKIEENQNIKELKELDLTGIVDHDISKEVPVNLFPVLTFGEFVKDFNYVRMNQVKSLQLHITNNILLPTF